MDRFRAGYRDVNGERDEFESLRAACEASGRCIVVMDECPSTQDIAKQAASPGLVVVARRQTAGRGRLGRSWADTAHAGLALTLTLDGADAIDAGVLSIGVGLAACQACESVLSSTAQAAPTTPPTPPDVGALPARSEPTFLGLRWPNDVVERQRGRKLGGVLIERSAELFIVGVGINCSQRESDWPDALRDRAASLLELNPALGSTSGLPPAGSPSLPLGQVAGMCSGSLRGLVAVELLGAIDRVRALPPERIAREWSGRETLIGTRRVFQHAGARITGLVESIDPLSHIVLRDDSGAIHRLPALTTSLVHDAVP